MGMIPSSPKGYYRLAVSVFFFVLGFCFASWASRIPDVQALLSLNDAELGTALFAAPLGQLPAMMIVGSLVNRFGSRAVLTAGVLLYSSALAALSFAPSFGHLFCGLFLLGFGNNLYSNSANTQAVSLERLFRRSIMGAFHGLWSLGGVAGGILGSILAASGVTPRAHLAGMAVFAVVMLLLFRRWVLPRDLFAARKKTLEGKRFATPDGLLILLGVIAFGSMATEGTMYNWNAVYFVTVIDAPTALVRLGYVVCMAAMVSGRFLLDGFITRFGPATVLQAGAVSMTVGFALLIGLPSMVPAAVGSAFIGFGMSAGVPVAYSMAGKSTRMAPSTAIAMVNAIGFLGFLLCPPLIGHLAYAFSIRIAFLPVACVALVIFALAALLRRHQRRQTP